MRDMAPLQNRHAWSCLICWRLEPLPSVASWPFHFFSFHTPTGPSSLSKYSVSSSSAATRRRRQNRPKASKLSISPDEREIPPARLSPERKPTGRAKAGGARGAGEERPSQCEAAEGGSSFGSAFIGVALPIIGNCSLIPNVSPQIILYGSFPLTFDWDWTSTGERTGGAVPESHGKGNVGLRLPR